MFFHSSFCIAVSLLLQNGVASNKTDMNLNSQVEDLLERMSKVKTELTVQRGESNLREAELRDQVSLLTKQTKNKENILKQLRDKCLALVKKVASLEAELKSKKRDDKTKLDEQMHENTFNQTTMGSRNVRQKKFSEIPRCAFSMGYDLATVITPGHILKFTHYITNDGSYYNKVTGVFTAPQNGLYVFHLEVATGEADEFIMVDLIAGGQFVASLYAHDKALGDKSYASTVVALRVGDTVFPKVSSFSKSGTGLMEIASLFTGFLLKAL